MDAETLGAFVEGTLDPQSVRRVLAHLDRCNICMAAVEAAGETVREERPTRANTPQRWWLAIAAAIALAVIGLAAFRVSLRSHRGEEPMARLIAAMPANARNVEPRLSGGFGWAEYRGPVRGDDSGTTTSDPGQLKLHGAAGEVLESAQRDPSPDAQHAAGVAMMLVEEPAKAIATLRPLAEKSSDARLWSDLAAAYYADAARRGLASNYPRALAAADQALRFDPRNAEALFNRALTLERLGLQQEAHKAWEQYLGVDSSSAWSHEARRHLDRLGRTSDLSMFRKTLPDFERSVHDGNARAIAAFVDRYPQQIRSYAEAEYLAQWGEALQGGNRDAAAERLNIARAAGDALVTSSGETLLRDAVRAIDSADDPRRNELAAAHLVYRSGRKDYAQKRLAEGEKELREAAAAFAHAGSPMALVARYYTANTVFDQNAADRARADLLALRAEIPLTYSALIAQVEWEIGLCHMVAGEWGSALTELNDAESRFVRLRETANAAFIQTLLAESLTYLGRDDEAWAARSRAFAAHASQGMAERNLATLGSATRGELFAQRYYEALSLMRLEIAEAESVGRDEFLVDSHVRRAVLNANLGRRSDAVADIDEAARASQRITDAKLRDLLTADIGFARGTLALNDDPVAARAALSDTIAAYRAMGRPIFLPEVYLQRARANEKLGDVAGALDDLENGIRSMEAQQVNSESGVGSGILDAGSALFAQAVRLSLASGDNERAFAYAERSRGRLFSNAPANMNDLRGELRGSHAAILETIALPDDLVSFFVDASGIRVSHARITRSQLGVLALASVDDGALGDRALATLNAILVTPFATELAQVSDLIMVPDRTLQSVPYAGLYDVKSKQRLVERVSVSLAPSAAALQLAKNETSRSSSVVAVELPSGEHAQSVGLPETEGELADVTALYGKSSLLEGTRATFDAFVAAASSADVIHLAGHSTVTRGESTDAALRFAGADEPVSWKAIARERLARRVVVLAACESLRSPARSMSLGAGFLAAGARSVVGTLVPIEDGDAREIFREVHRHLAAGDTPVQAVRKAQLDQLARGGHAWRAISILTREFPHT
ncbi:MAG TPA: CHAT domain-containing protein [Thermoanaerobaculia bacterium]|nr:CHAT domain-containing protein [Thermoanaerobaculia bacterium]